MTPAPIGLGRGITPETERNIMRFTTKTYRCGGYSNYSGHCGARDCSTCYPGCGVEETQLDLRDAGYSYDAHDGEWSRYVGSSEHTARKVGAKHGFSPGTRYRVATTRYVNDDTRCSYHGRAYTMVKGPFQSPLSK